MRANFPGGFELRFRIGEAAQADVLRAPPRAGSASIAACAPPNWLTNARNVAGPTFSLRISRSQARRWASLRRVPVSGFLLVLANTRLLAGHQPADIGRMADIEKDGE